MFELSSAPAAPRGLLADLAAMVGAVVSLPVAPDDAARIDQLRLLERLVRAAAAAQARVTAVFVASQRAEQVARGVPAAQVGRGIADQVARARMESPHRGSRFVGAARALVEEMPRTLQALERGDIGEWTATCLVRETAVLQRADRSDVDERLEPVLAAAGVSHGRLVRAARSAAVALDVAAVARRTARAESERRVSLRPAPDAMVWLTALLPVAQGVACFAALGRAADGARSGGDPRSRQQVMADALVQRLTGRDPVVEAVPVRVDLVMPEESLFDGGPAPASLRARGQRPIELPAVVARRMVRAATAQDRAWLRRLYAAPGSGDLVAMDRRSRRFPAGLAELITLADGTCRTPWCDAPVRHVDHSRRHADGGPTAWENGQGLCERCNLAKEAPGWSARQTRGRSVTSTTPTGHATVSRPPPVLGLPTRQERPARPLLVRRT